MKYIKIFENIDNDSIRSKYQKYGVENFYQNHFNEYKNPHEIIIQKSISFVNDNWNVNLNKVLDLAAGDGAITKQLIKIGLTNIDAVDPYSYKFYNTETNKKCSPISFDDIIQGSLDNKHYTTTICSFALHLLEPSKLPTFLYKMTQISDQLLILSPHKRPEIKEEWGWSLENEIVIDKVRTRLFNNIFFENKLNENNSDKEFEKGDYVFVINYIDYDEKFKYAIEHNLATISEIVYGSYHQDRYYIQYSTAKLYLDDDRENYRTIISVKKSQLRHATPEEIEQYKLEQNIEKYNL